MIKLVAIDMDDTLLRKDKSFDKARFEKVYRSLQKEGIILAIASGNPYPRLQEYMSFMEYRDIYFASDNGNYLVKGEELLAENELKHEELIDVVAYLETIGTFSIVFSDGKKTYSKWINSEYTDYIQSFNRHLNIIPHLDELQEKKIVKVAVHSELKLNDAKELVNQLMIRFPNLTAVTSGGGWLDFYHRDGGKGSAIHTLQEKYQITHKETMVFGDSLNDASMVQYANYSIVMGNGDEELKEISNYEIGTNEDQAVLEILELFLKERNLSFLNQYKIN